MVSSLFDAHHLTELGNISTTDHLSTPSTTEDIYSLQLLVSQLAVDLLLRPNEPSVSTCIFLMVLFSLCVFVFFYFSHRVEINDIHPSLDFVILAQIFYFTRSHC